MKAILVKQANQLSYTDIEKPEPGEHEVRVRVKAAGLCGSDFHIFHGTYPAQYPLVQGHEFSGEIDAVSAGVRGWAVGQRVTADPNIYCHTCHYCLKDQENMCLNAQAIGVTRNGAFAEYVLVPDTQLYELPDALSFEEGALIEPLACVIYGMKRLAMPFGSSAIVFGAGPMGLLLLLALKAGGASKVAMMDIDEKRLEKAKELGANELYTDLAKAREHNAYGFDVVVDATGNAKVISGMFSVAAKRAKILQFGCADSSAMASISPFAIYDHDWEYIGTRTAVYTFSQAIEMVAHQKIPAMDVVSEVVPLERMAQYLQNGKPQGALKIIAKP